MLIAHLTIFTVLGEHRGLRVARRHIWTQGLDGSGSVPHGMNQLQTAPSSSRPFKRFFAELAARGRSLQYESSRQDKNERLAWAQGHRGYLRTSMGERARGCLRHGDQLRREALIESVPSRGERQSAPPPESGITATPAKKMKATGITSTPWPRSSSTP